MTKKKNRVSIFGKTFHVTPAGKILPLGSKNNWFTKCVSKAAKGQMNTGVDLSQAAIKANKNTFLSAIRGCQIRGGSLKLPSFAGAPAGAARRGRGRPKGG